MSEREQVASAPAHWGPRFDPEYRCLRHKEHACPSCLAYAVGDAQSALMASEWRALEAERRLEALERFTRLVASCGCDEVAEDRLPACSVQWPGDVDEWCFKCVARAELDALSAPCSRKEPSP